MRNCHFYYWCHRQNYIRLRHVRLALNILSFILLSTGTVIGPLISNVWVLAALSWSFMMVKSILEFRKYDTKVAMSRLAYTSYGKCLATQHRDELLWTHTMMLDLAPLIPDSIKQRYLGQPQTDYLDGIKDGIVPPVLRLPQWQGAVVAGNEGVSQEDGMVYERDVV